MIYNICQELCKDVDYNQNMNIKEEIKVIIARRGTTMKKVCEIMSEKTSKHYSYNNISNKLRNGTIKFNEVQMIFEILNYELCYKDLLK